MVKKLTAGKHRDSSPPTDNQGQLVAPQLLSTHGERFMSMFDDYDEAEAQRQRVQSNKAAGPIYTGEQQRTNKRMKQRQQKEDTKKDIAAPSKCPGAHASSTGPSSSGHLANKGRPPPKNEIEEIIFNDKYAPAGSSAALTSRSSLHQGNSARANLDMERRLFMSSKASKVHQSAHAQLHESTELQDEELDPELTPDEFKRLQLEVERLGASALDKRERKKWQAAMLARLGAKPEKSPRMPASIGIGMAKKQAQRDAKKLEEAFETGMAQRKGMGKKKRAAQSKDRDWGLQELGRGFKGGILRIKSSKGKRTGSSSRDAGPVRKMGGGKGGKRQRRT